MVDWNSVWLFIRDNGLIAIVISILTLIAVIIDKLRQRRKKPNFKHYSYELSSSGEASPDVPIDADKDARFCKINILHVRGNKGDIDARFEYSATIKLLNTLDKDNNPFKQKTIEVFEGDLLADVPPSPKRFVFKFPLEAEKWKKAKIRFHGTISYKNSVKEFRTRWYKIENTFNII